MNCDIMETISGEDSVKRRHFNERGYVALYMASHRGHTKLVSKLVNLGMNVCRKMPSGRSPIHVAVYKRRIACVNLLIGR